MSFLEAIWSSLACWIAWLACASKAAMIEVADLIISVIIGAIVLVLAILPTFTLGDPQLEGTAVGWLNYFIPLDMLLLGFSTIMFCWILYRLYVVLLRWGKVADDS